MKLVRRNELKEWLDADICAMVTDALKQHLEAIYQERADCFILGDAQKTQETRAMMIGSEQVLQDLIEFFEQKSELLFEQTDIQIVEEDLNGERLE